MWPQEFLTYFKCQEKERTKDRLEKMSNNNKRDKRLNFVHQNSSESGLSISRMQRKLHSISCSLFIFIHLIVQILNQSDMKDTIQ